MHSGALRATPCARQRARCWACSRGRRSTASVAALLLWVICGSAARAGLASPSPPCNPTCSFLERSTALVKHGTCRSFVQFPPLLCVSLASLQPHLLLPGMPHHPGEARPAADAYGGPVAQGQAAGRPALAAPALQACSGSL